MKRVCFLRHAKSDWGDLSLADHDRPLNEKGRKAAAKMGRRMAAMDLGRVQVLCSTARRARETLDLALDAGKLDWPVTFSEKLYGANAATILEEIHGGSDDFETLLLVGHNPGFQDAALALTGGGEATLLHQLDYKYPTGALAVLEFSARRFADIEFGKGLLDAFLRPKALTLG